MKNNRLLSKFWIIFIFVALFWQLIYIKKGVDIGDAGFMLANYANVLKFPDKYDMGRFLTSYFGGLLYAQLPSHQYIIFRILNFVVADFSLLIAFHVLKRFWNKNIVAFLIMLASISLWHYPAILYYNTVSIFFLSIFLLLLDKWMVSKKTYLIAISGFVIGFSVFFRLPNITFAALYLCVLWYDIISDRKKNIKLDTLAMLLGGIVGTALGFAIVFTKMGTEGFMTSVDIYLNMSTNTTQSHGLLGFVKIMGSHYFASVTNHAMFFVFNSLFVVALFFMYLKNKVQDNKKWFYVILALSFIVAIAVTYYKVFPSFGYPMVMITPFVYFANIFAMIKEKKDNKELSTLSLAMFIISIVICYGTDNGVQHFVLELMWLLPLTAYNFYNIIKKYSYNGKMNFVKAGALALSVIAFTNFMGNMVLSSIRNPNIYQYGEEKDEDGHFKYNIDTLVTSNKELYSCYTSKKLTVALSEITGELTKEKYKDKKVFAVGHIPILFSLIENENLMCDSFWPDMDSVTLENIQLALDKSKTENNLPVILIYKNTYAPNSNDSEKIAYVKEFCKKENYNLVKESQYEGEPLYTILEPQQ